MDAARVRELAAHVRQLQHVPHTMGDPIALEDVVEVPGFDMGIEGVKGGPVVAGSLAFHAVLIFGEIEDCVTGFDGTASWLLGWEDDEPEAEELFHPLQTLSRLTPDGTADVLEMVADGVRPREAWARRFGEG